MTVFTKARIKLTLWYSLVIFIISSTLSLLFYNRVSLLLDFEFVRIERRIEREQQMGMNTGFGQNAVARPLTPPRINPEEIVETKRKIAFQLIMINLGVSTGFAIISYFFAHRTLKPIQLVHEQQKQFITDAAHELRTPLTALKTSLQVNLLDKQLPSKTKRILHENLADVSNLENLTTSLLKLAENNIVSSMSEVAIDKLLKQSLKQIKPLFEEKNISIVYKNKFKNAKVFGNETQLVELFTIILDNARKYSYNNSKVEITTNQSRRTIQINISDHGQGMSQEEQKHIFDRFYRADSSRNKSQANGFGLGLALAKKIINNHQGKIEVISQKKRGSQFIVTLNKSAKK
ncbi:MAG: sensor histidine kinase [Patescibacteria group bacterium]